MPTTQHHPDHRRVHLRDDVYIVSVKINHISHLPRSIFMNVRWNRLCLLFLLPLVGLGGCEGCDEKNQTPTLKVPFSDDFNRKTLGSQWFSEMSGRWRIVASAKNQRDGRLCVEQARNNPLFLLGRLPRDVEIEFDAWAHERTGDVKIELFTDGRFHASGYVLVHGGWNNSTSIIDRLGEHNKNCKWKQQSKRILCRRWKRGGPKKDRKYHWRVVRRGEKLQWFVDGKLYMQYHDPSPLDGKNHGFFAFSNWIAYTCFDNLKIRALETVTSSAGSAPQPRTVRQAPPVRRIVPVKRIDPVPAETPPSPQVSAPMNRPRVFPKKRSQVLMLNRPKRPLLRVKSRVFLQRRPMPTIKYPSKKVRVLRLAPRPSKR
tara:strand:+ start:2469 stop:3587 length:1119 start_codon:yes stop_codon:yes gene_type:complete